MLFQIEANREWAYKLNSKLRRCHRESESHTRSNYQEEFKQLTDQMSDEEILEELFVECAEMSEKEFDFDSEIEQQKT